MDDSARRRRVLAVVGATVTSAAAGCTTTVGKLRGAASDLDGELFVAPGGSDANPGTTDAPLRTVGAALDRATPGDTVTLSPGEYAESVSTQRDGDPEAPITIRGPPEAVLRPPANADVGIRIQHHHTHVRGITIDGLADPDRPFEDSSLYADNCVLMSPVSRYEDGVEYLRGIVFEPSRLGNSGRAMVQTIRIRDTTIGGFEVTGPAGVRYDDRIPGHETGHVGEIVYVGNAETARGEPYYRYETLDRSRGIRVHHIDNSEGYRNAEFVDIKLGSTDVTVEYCTNRNSGHSSEPTGWPAVNLGGNDCTIRWNDFAEGPTGVNVAAWVPTGDIDGDDWARDNEIYGNRLADFSERVFNFDGGGDTVGSGPENQAILCGNNVEGPDAGDYTDASEPCTDAIPEGDGIGHLGGDSPWSDG
jgi:hypothetical protein